MEDGIKKRQRILWALSIFIMVWIEGWNIMDKNIFKYYYKILLRDFISFLIIMRLIMAWKVREL